MENAALVWAAALTWSQPTFSRIAAGGGGGRRAPPSVGEGTNVPAITEDLFKSFNFSAYPINNTLGVTSNEIFFGRICTHLGKASFQFPYAIQGFFKASLLGFAKLLNIFL
jgi:hypothetical protein